jgi:hypothetical protein|tara:strand:+ start:54 stop:869 length:816 start_codon:yes stop_codon:yes gene_type:complete
MTIERPFTQMTEQEKLEWTFREKLVKQKRQPNTTVEEYGHDNGSKSIVGKTGSDAWTGGAVQNIDWTSPENQFNYTWNKNGYRGPDDNGDVDIIFAGSSLTMGTGVPYEKTYPHLVSEKLNLKHINISDFDTLLDLADSLLDFKHLTPKYVILSDCWAINSTAWLMRFWLRKEKDEKIKNLIRETFKQSNSKIFQLFDLALMQAFPNAKYYILEPDERRKYWFYNYQPIHIKSILYRKEEMLDLGRDQIHPGPKTHNYLADKILTELNKGI